MWALTRVTPIMIASTVKTCDFLSYLLSMLVYKNHTIDVIVTRFITSFVALPVWVTGSVSLISFLGHFYAIQRKYAPASIEGM